MPKKEGGLYYDYVDFPIHEPSQEAIAGYTWPAPNPPEYNQKLGKQADPGPNDRFRCGWRGDHRRWDLRTAGTPDGLREFLDMLLVSEPETADRMMEKATDIYVEACDSYLAEVGDKIQVFTYWDDVCGQNGWLIRPETYKKDVMPKQKRLVETIRAKTNAKLFYHGCGAMFDLIPHLIEIGFEYH